MERESSSTSKEQIGIRFLTGYQLELFQQDHLWQVPKSRSRKNKTFLNFAKLQKILDWGGPFHKVVTPRHCSTPRCFAILFVNWTTFLPARPVKSQSVEATLFAFNKSITRAHTSLNQRSAQCWFQLFGHLGILTWPGSPSNHSRAAKVTVPHFILTSGIFYSIWLATELLPVWFWCKT